MSFDEIFDLTAAGVYFNFYNIPYKAGALAQQSNIPIPFYVCTLEKKCTR